MSDPEEPRYRPANTPEAPTHDAAFVARAIETLRDQGLDVWLFGGWAEEMLGLAEPWPHGDIDLLYLGQDFGGVDELVDRQAWVVVKRLPHKRAFELDGVTVDVFLVRSDEQGYYSEFFELRHSWPDDVFASSTGLAIASTTSVRDFPAAFRRLAELHEERLARAQSGDDEASAASAEPTDDPAGRAQG